MARRTPIQIALEKRINKACQDACLGRSINIMKLSEISDAAKVAAANGGDIEQAAIDAAKRLDTSVRQ